jgi:hypothetical protein
MKNLVHHKKIKHIVQHHYIVNEMVNANKVAFEYYFTSNMTINVLTKLVPKPKQSICTKLLGFKKLDQMGV